MARTSESDTATSRDPSTPGALFVVGGRPYVDSQALRNLTRTHTVTQVAGGWRVQGDDGEAVLCLGTSCPPLPEQRGALDEARATRGIGLADACATWLAGGAARLAGKYPDWPKSSACGCGATCGCGPCQRRHGHADSRTVSDEDAAQYVLDAVVFEVGEYMPETERREPSGFLLHLYLTDGTSEQRAATFEIRDRHSLGFTWLVEPTSATLRTKVVQAIDRLIQEAYDEENHHDPG